MVGDRAGTSNFEQAKTETSVTEVRFFATEREATLDILQRADDDGAESTWDLPKWVTSVVFSTPLRL